MKRRVFIIIIITAVILALSSIGFAAWGIIGAQSGESNGEFIGYTIIDLENITNENTKQAFLYNESGLYSTTGLGNSTSFSIQVNVVQKAIPYNIVIDLIDYDGILTGATVTSIATSEINNEITTISTGNTSITISNVNSTTSYMITFNILTDNSTYQSIYSRLDSGFDEFNLKITANTENGNWSIDKTILMNAVFQDLMPVSKPTALANLVYNGNSQSLVDAPDNGTKYNLDISTGINAGTYNITATLISGYCWSDDSSTSQYIFSSSIAQKLIIFNDDEISTNYTSNNDSKWSVIKNFINGKSDMFIDESNNPLTSISGLSYSLSSMTDNTNTYNNSTNANDYVHGSTYRVSISISLTNTNYYLRSTTKSGATITNNLTSLIFKYKTVKKYGDSSYNYTIEEAIANITSGIIETCPGGDSVFTYFTKINGTQSYTLQAKLRIPFANVDMDYHGSNGWNSSDKSNYSNLDSIHVNEVNSVYSVLYVPVGITINTSNTIIVGGLIGTTGTVKNRGVLMNYGIINVQSGSLGVYGFIKGTGCINATGTTSIVEVFKIYDWEGGQQGGGKVNSKIFPINAYSAHNCSCDMKIYSGATLEAFWIIEFNNDLYRGFQRGDKNGNVYIISNNSNALFNLSSGYLEKKVLNNATNTELKNVTGNNQVKKQIDIINIYGNCSDGSISMQINATGSSFTMSNSDGTALPISYMYINICSGTSQFNKSYKFLPGSHLNVSPEATLSIMQSGIMFFYSLEQCILDENYGTVYSGPNRFATQTGGNLATREDAYLTVDGTLNISNGGYISGLIKTTGSTGIINNNGYNYATIKIIDTINKTTILGFPIANVNTKDRTDYMRGNVISGINSYNCVTMTTGTWYANNNCWYKPGSITIKILDNANNQIDSCTINAGQSVSSSFIDLTDNKFNKLYYIFDGLFTDINGVNSFNNSTIFYSDTIIYAVYSPDPNYHFYHIDFNPNGGTMTSSESVDIVDNGVITGVTLPNATKDGYTLKWKRNSDDEEFNPNTEYSFSSLFDEDSIELIAEWTIVTYTITIKSNNTSYGTVSPTSVGNVPYGTVITISSNKLNINGTTVTATPKSDGDTFSTWSITNNYVVTGSIEITANFTHSQSCLTPNTLITMADGSVKEIQYLTTGDMVMVFNHETGMLDIAPVTFNEFEEQQWFNVIHLIFNNGKDIGVISEHGFFDLDTMRYEYITEDNYLDFIGHKFYTIDGEYTTLVDAYISEEYTMCYSLPSYYHLNLFTEGLLSMPGGITGLFNYFEYADNLQYDQEKMADDINTYGLFTVEEFEPYGVTEEMFYAYAGQYLKVSLGKGILTEEYLMYLVERYGKYTE